VLVHANHLAVESTGEIEVPKEHVPWVAGHGIAVARVFAPAAAAEVRSVVVAVARTKIAGIQIEHGSSFSRTKTILPGGALRAPEATFGPLE
jgi:hypothetical protein